MIEHKCSFKAFVRITSSITFLENIKRKIMATLFGHYLDFASGLVVDSSLLDNCCGKWKCGTTFSFVLGPVKRLEMTTEEVERTLGIPSKGWKIDLKVENYLTTFYKQLLHTYIMSHWVFVLYDIPHYQISFFLLHAIGRLLLKNWFCMWRRKTKPLKMKIVSSNFSSTYLIFNCFLFTNSHCLLRKELLRYI